MAESCTPQLSLMLVIQELKLILQLHSNSHWTGVSPTFQDRKMNLTQEKPVQGYFSDVSAHIYYKVKSNYI